MRTVLVVLVILGLIVLAALWMTTDSEGPSEALQQAPAQAPALGPVDGLDLPPTDLERVAIGELAPDFSLPSYHGDIVTLSDYRGEKNVVLVFYRGHW
jgi:hypothetical protein